MIFLISYGICLGGLLLIAWTVLGSKNRVLQSDFFFFYGNYVISIAVYLAALIVYTIIFSSEQQSESLIILYRISRSCTNSTIINGFFFQLAMIYQRYKVVFSQESIIQTESKSRIPLLIGCHLPGFLLTSPLYFCKIGYDRERMRITGMALWVNDLCDITTFVVGVIAFLIAIVITFLFVRFLITKQRPFNAYIIYSLLQSVYYVPTITFAISKILGRYLESELAYKIATVNERCAGLICLIIALSLLLCSRELRKEIKFWKKSPFSSTKISTLKQSNPKWGENGSSSISVTRISLT